MRAVVVLCILLLITAWYAPVVAADPSDLDTLIIAGLDNTAVTDEIKRVLCDEDMVLSFETAWGLAEEEIAGVSHSTYERIRQTYATPERVNNLMEPHIKRDLVVDNRFTGMPYESEGWLIRLIVEVVITVVLIVAGCIIAPHVSSWLASRAAIQAAEAAADLAWESAAYNLHWREV